MIMLFRLMGHENLMTFFWPFGKWILSQIRVACEIQLIKMGFWSAVFLMDISIFVMPQLAFMPNIWL